jgi:hypothetical protein
LRNSSVGIPAWNKMPLSIPMAISSCFGTTKEKGLDTEPLNEEEGKRFSYGH